MLEDNIGMNAKSNFVQPLYHGTSRSAVQFETIENERSFIFKGGYFKKGIIGLPERYTVTCRLHKSGRPVSWSKEEDEVVGSNVHYNPF